MLPQKRILYGQRSFVSDCLCRSHRIAVLSPLPVRIDCPIRRKCYRINVFCMARELCIRLPCRPHRIAILSQLPVRIDFPSGANATASTREVCPEKVCIGLPCRSHRIAVLSQLPVRIDLPIRRKCYRMNAGSMS